MNNPFKKNIKNEKLIEKTNYWEFLISFIINYKYVAKNR
jgi:hypothetical protein